MGDNEEKQEEKIVEKVENVEKRGKERKSIGKGVTTFVIIVFMVELVILGLFVGVNHGLKDCVVVSKEKECSQNDFSFYEESSDTETETKVESTWKSIGTDVSKVESIYKKLEKYTYLTNRVRGGYSFYDTELFNIAANEISKEDLTDIEMDEYGYTYYGNISRDKIDAILKKYFGNNYNYEYSLNRNSEFNYKEQGKYRSLGSGLLFSILKYDEGTKQFKVYYHGADGTSGPSAKIVTKKVEDVLEKDNMIKIIERSIYVDSNSVGSDSIYYSVHSNPTRTLLLKTMIFKIDGIEDKEINVNDYLDSASYITSIYDKGEDGNYYFVSSELSDKPF